MTQKFVETGKPYDYHWDTSMIFNFKSSRMNSTFSFFRWTTYSIDLDLDADSNTFEVTFHSGKVDNPKANVATYCSAMSKYDTCEIYYNKKLVFVGRTDEIRYKWDEGSNEIVVGGRDLRGLLIDSDAAPSNKKNLKPIKYIKSAVKKFGIKYFKSNKKIKTIKKFQIGVGESEMDVIKSILDDGKHKIWYDRDVLRVGKWNTNGDPKWVFTRGLPANTSGNPILSLTVVESSVGEVSRITIYGGDKKKKVKGTVDNKKLRTKRKIKTTTNINYDKDSGSVKKLKSQAKKDLREAFRDSYYLEITTFPGKSVYLPNRCCRVIDETTRINSTFFIKNVNYSKSPESGTICTIGMVPADSTLKVLWAGQGKGKNGGLTGFKNKSVSAFINDKKG
jgi:prophage tail gpP-like protein